ncbi:MAG: choice-of-anchor Q domain-containing protein, partial [Pyrinomonadaceae bacterium]
FSGDTATNITGVDPNLGPLQNNGGPTLTHLPNAGSPVIDKSAFFNTTEDQRGLARLVDDHTIANAPGGNGSDMGSVEVQGGGGPTPTPTPPASPTPTPSPSPSPGSTPLYTRGDYDGDNNTDPTVWRPSAFAAPNENVSAFYTFRSTDASFFGIQFGNTGDVAIAGDFDGDNKTDFGISRYTSGDGVDLVYLESSTNTAKFPVWGIAGDIFVSGDYDGDKKTDVMAWRPSDGTWYIVNSSGSNGGYTFIQHGQAGDKPYAMDTDGDGKSNLAYYRPSMGRWVIKDAVGPGITGVNFGTASDVPVPADYDGDNKDDIAVFRDGLWIIRPSTNVIDVQFIPFGSTGDVPVPGDYDGDNLYDRAVYRQGIWHMLRSSQGYTGFQFGAATDTAMPKAYIP